MDTVEEIAARMADIAMRYLDTLPPEERAARLEAFCRAAERLPNGPESSNSSEASAVPASKGGEGQ